MGGKAEQRQRKELKQQQERRREKLISIFTRTAVVVVSVLALYVFYQGIFGGVPVMPADRVAAHDHVRGNPEAALIITVYADFECPSCAAEMQVIERSWPRVRDDVLLVYRHFPLDIHRHSFLAARYAEAAGRQDRFWEMHDLLFNNQLRWAGTENAGAMFDSFAEQLGLDMEQLRNDLADGAIRDKIVADQQGGIRAGVRATPALFFNGRQVSTPRSSAAFRDRIDEALQDL